VQSETLKLLAMKKKFTAPFLTKQLKADLRATITSKLDWGNKYVMNMPYISCLVCSKLIYNI